MLGFVIIDCMLFFIWQMWRLEVDRRQIAMMAAGALDDVGVQDAKSECAMWAIVFLGMVLLSLTVWFGIWETIIPVFPWVQPDPHLMR